jgi:hypothetical protein
MHVHKPKPLHGLREFLSEISVIVVGVLIALALEQGVVALDWSHKVAQAEVRLAADLKDDSSFATQYGIMKPCAEAYLDRMQTDLLKHDSADMERLYQFGRPTVGYPWKVVAWENAVASQIGDHIDNSRYEVYAEAFRGAALLRDFNLRNRDDYALAMTGRFALPPDSRAMMEQLAAVERLRSYIRIGRLIAANDLVDPVRAQLGIAPRPEVVAEHRDIETRCLVLLGLPSR